MTNVLVTGGTGFIGSNLVSALNARNFSITVLGRDPSKVRARLGNRLRAVKWDPSESGDWTSEIGRHEVLVHLAGEPAVGRRLDDGARRAVRNSRVRSTRRIVDAIGQAEIKPRVFLCASAVGYYGTENRAGVEVDESAPMGDGFLSQLCGEWESAALRAELFGVRVVLLRFGVVLDAQGGALGRLLPIFRLGLGGRLGSGDQPMPWIAMDDAVEATMMCIERTSVTGPVNLVSPEIRTNAQFTQALASLLHRPAILPVPSGALRLALGEGADALLRGTPVVPGVLTREGYNFRYPDLTLALAAALARADRQ